MITSSDELSKLLLPSTATRLGVRRSSKSWSAGVEAAVDAVSVSAEDVRVSLDALLAIGSMMLPYGVMLDKRRDRSQHATNESIYSFIACDSSSRSS